MIRDCLINHELLILKEYADFTYMHFLVLFAIEVLPKCSEAELVAANKIAVVSDVIPTAARTHLEVSPWSCHQHQSVVTGESHCLLLSERH